MQLIHLPCIVASFGKQSKSEFKNICAGPVGRRATSKLCLTSGSYNAIYPMLLNTEKLTSPCHVFDWDAKLATYLHDKPHDVRDFESGCHDIELGYRTTQLH